MPLATNFTVIQIVIRNGTGNGYLTIETGKKNSKGFFGASSPKGGFARFDFIKLGSTNSTLFDESKIVRDDYKWAYPIPDYNNGGLLTAGKFILFYTCESKVSPDDLKIRVTGDHTLALTFNHATVNSDGNISNFEQDLGIGTINLDRESTKGAGYTIPYELSGSFSPTGKVFRGYEICTQRLPNDTNQSEYTWVQATNLQTGSSATSMQFGAPNTVGVGTLSGLGIGNISGRGSSAWALQRSLIGVDLSKIDGTISSIKLQIAPTGSGTIDAHIFLLPYRSNLSASYSKAFNDRTEEDEDLGLNKFKSIHSVYKSSSLPPEYLNFKDDQRISYNDPLSICTPVQTISDNSIKTFEFNKDVVKQANEKKGFMNFVVVGGKDVTGVTASGNNGWGFGGTYASAPSFQITSSL
tara:strand:+ start:229 stop:1461 length:1233 start_codon:yes stop_codon:yes gene_type:complete